MANRQEVRQIEKGNKVNNDSEYKKRGAKTLKKSIKSGEKETKNTTFGLNIFTEISSFDKLIL